MEASRHQTSRGAVFAIDGRRENVLNQAASFGRLTRQFSAA